MLQKEFKAHGVMGTSYWDGIEVMIEDDNIYYRHFYQNSDDKIVYHRIIKSQIRYARPHWSKEPEPYFNSKYGRLYLSNFMAIGR